MKKPDGVIGGNVIVESPSRQPKRSPVVVAAGRGRHQTVGQPGFLRRVWNKWLDIAQVIGTVQMIIILTLLYWTLFALTAIPFKLFADPLQMRRRSSSQWSRRAPDECGLEAMKNQF